MPEISYRQQRVAVIGLGISGRSAVRFLLQKNALVTGVDRNRELFASDAELKALQNQGALLLHESGLTNLTNIDLVVVSPGIPPEHPLYAEALNKGIEVIGEAELAFRTLGAHRLLAVTGSNGKTTVVLLITHVLNHSGKKALSLGNVGTPLTGPCIEEVDKEAIIVAELSSFQLETLKSPAIDAAVILNITPNHLDRYSSMQSYAKAKLSIKNCLKVGGKLYLGEQAFCNYGAGIAARRYGRDPSSHAYVDGHSIFFDGKRECTLPLHYKGHDLDNILAAYALCREVGVFPEQFLKALSTFKKPAHRIEFVDTIDGISYYNDSKGSNIDAVIKAVDFLSSPIVLIAGGVDKGSSYLPWVAAFNGKVKAICAIGQAAEKIERELGPYLRVERCSSLALAVKCAAHLVGQEGIVLLSPGCSSYDMFQDYIHRGEEFKKIVKQLHLGRKQ